MDLSFTNKLAAETSPYLLQHAHNPVDWYPWTKEALDKAVAEQKPILVSIGYSACHWCHVMERESFEDPEVAILMNEHFINIKIDREERPDLDHIYMDAVQAMTGSGGWPLNVFLTPDKNPFYGGTYFPPVPAHNRPSWKDTLMGIISSWKTRRTEIETQSLSLLEYLQKNNAHAGFTRIGDSDADEPDTFNNNHCHQVFENIMNHADKEWGGFGKAPKFPQTYTIQYLLHYYHCTGNEEALRQAKLSLDKMIQGGIYDQLGGGFSRYSTDTEWLAPHFEKMLYDNALLLSVLCDIYQITKDDDYEIVIRDTIHFLNQELKDPSGGFYAALDADSEGEEGKFYVWQKQEIESILEKDAAIFCRFYDVTEEGNWEHKNILRVEKKAALFCAENHIPVNEFLAGIASSRKRLLERRKDRQRPQTDDKVILGWNALLITSLCKASSAIHSTEYAKMAKETFSHLIRIFSISGDPFGLYHTAKNNIARFPAFLDDYAYLIQAAIHLFEISSDNQYITQAEGLTRKVLENFSAGDSPYFYYSSINQDDLIVRKIEIYDGAQPSGNSVMALNLAYLAAYLDHPEWENRSSQMLEKTLPAVTKYPSSFGVWAGALINRVEGMLEITVAGPEFETWREGFLDVYLPNKILSSRELPMENSLFWKGKKEGIYICSGQGCLAPVFSVKEAVKILETMGKF